MRGHVGECETSGGSTTMAPTWYSLTALTGKEAGRELLRPTGPLHMGSIWCQHLAAAAYPPAVNGRPSEGFCSLRFIIKFWQLDVGTNEIKLNFVGSRKVAVLHAPSRTCKSRLTC
jgi:hypothetical protein